MPARPRSPRASSSSGAPQRRPARWPWRHAPQPAPAGRVPSQRKAVRNQQPRGTAPRRSTPMQSRGGAAACNRGHGKQRTASPSRRCSFSPGLLMRSPAAMQPEPHAKSSTRPSVGGEAKPSVPSSAAVITSRTPPANSPGNVNQPGSRVPSRSSGAAEPHPASPPRPAGPAVGIAGAQAQNQSAELLLHTRPHASDSLAKGAGAMRKNPSSTCRECDGMRRDATGCEGTRLAIASPRAARSASNHRHR